ncbi:MAG TPA: exodeoxyribonuclease III [Anaerohalosphaeraceae bacterium]|nr:exodeoxyribonuclease III [Anaerohalosphaeraceae bacterium]HPC64370.1 exodeoxyribonuclease III [Anaerohalosphaeraceae bacterium]HRS70976.1 exodeoxyribonuclease III [Anaerohalosphaeraceae bacterium]HRV20034.1 exodeoxyribonuclease III [Anaerohalosphaeraceae bacterium]
MRIATFNANSIRSRLDIILKWINLNNPDILAIQETKVQDSDFPLSAFSSSGYKIVFSGQKSYNGVAILSKIAPQDVVVKLEQDTSYQARFLKAKIGKIIVVNTYAPQGMDVNSDKFRYKLDWFNWLRLYFEKNHTPDQPIIWAGDLNVALQDIDVYDPKGLWGHVCYCETVQKALLEVMSWGFVDIFRLKHPEPGHYTFWDYRVLNAFKRNLGWRLDYIMTTSSLADKCTDCWIDTLPRGWEKSSDHTFLVADFDI